MYKYIERDRSYPLLTGVHTNLHGAGDGLAQPPVRVG